MDILGVFENITEEETQAVADFEYGLGKLDRLSNPVPYDGEDYIEWLKEENVVSSDVTYKPSYKISDTELGRIVNMMLIN